MLLRDGRTIPLQTPSDYPEHTDTAMIRQIKEVQEPFVDATIIAPDEYAGPLMELCAVSQSYGA